jgi:hypothetical protein
MAITTNGQHPPAEGAADDPADPAPDVAASPLATLREHPVNVHLFRGYGPLVVGIILFLLMVVLAPTVAPEHDVERPVDAPTETTSP